MSNELVIPDDPPDEFTIYADYQRVAGLDGKALPEAATAWNGLRKEGKRRGFVVSETFDQRTQRFSMVFKRA